jgi:uncharacterized membrane protein YGL010W
MDARNGCREAKARRRSMLAHSTSRVLAALGVVLWLVGSASFGQYEDLRPSLLEKLVAGATIGGPVLVAAGALALTALYLQRRR